MSVFLLNFLNRLDDRFSSGILTTVANRRNFRLFSIGVSSVGLYSGISGSDSSSYSTHYQHG